MDYLELALHGLPIPPVPDGYWLGELTGSYIGRCHVFPITPGVEPYRLPHNAVCGAMTGRGAERVGTRRNRHMCRRCERWLENTTAT